MINTLFFIRNNKLFTSFFIFFCLNSSLSQANESNFNAFVKGSFSQIQQQHKNSPYIMAFWSETCAYCMKELALFGRLLKQYPKIKLITISTDPFLDDKTVQQILASKNLQGTKTWVFADNFAERLYFDINPHWRGELLLTYFFDHKNKMLKHLGVIQETELAEWLTEQSIAAGKSES